jgi:hypothetical protein
MRKKNLPVPAENIDSVIQTIRGQKVILDADLAHIYGVSTKRLNEQFRRNLDRFPADFAFQLTEGEKAEVVANCDHLRQLKFSHVLPWAFTENGAIMAASILNSPEAVRLSVFVVRAFVKMRELLGGTGDQTKQLKELEAELRSRLDVHEWWPTARSHCGRAPADHALARSAAGTGPAATTNRIPRPAERPERWREQE